MKRLLIAMMFLLAAPVAWADTDYACLKGCVSDGQPHHTCLAKCTYGEMTRTTMDTRAQAGCLNACVNGGGSRPACMQQCEPPPSPEHTQNRGPAEHGVLSTPIPVDGIVMKPKAVSAAPMSLDYSCLSTCMQNGMQYQSCSQRCSK